MKKKKITQVFERAKISLKYISFKKHNIKNNYMIEVIKWQFVYLTPKMILPAYLSN